MGATFISCDESSWPNFATFVTTDKPDHSPVSNLARPGVFRRNISLSRERFACILNPTTETFDGVIKPLLDEAHERVARAARAKKRIGLKRREAEPREQLTKDL